MENDIIEPEFLRNQSSDEILTRMITRLPDDIDVSEGSILYDLLVGVAKEKAQMVEFQLNETLKVLFAQNAYDIYLDFHAHTRGMVPRRGPTAAITTLTVIGIPYTVIPEGFKFSTEAVLDAPSIEFEVTDETVIDKNGNGSVPVRAILPGPSGNVAAGTITLMSKPMKGIQSVTNLNRATGGTSRETDDVLKQRILDHDASQGVSFCGSPSDYRRWAMEVDGVGSVVVIPATDDSGLVTLVVTDANGEPANEKIRQDIYNHIIRPDNPDDRLTHPNALLAVVAPTIIPISITASVKTTIGLTPEDVKTRFKENLAAYYERAVKEGAIKYVQIVATLADTVGVDDFSNLLLNNGIANIPLTKVDYPFTESVVFLIG